MLPTQKNSLAPEPELVRELLATQKKSDEIIKRMKQLSEMLSRLMGRLSLSTESKESCGQRQ